MSTTVNAYGRDVEDEAKRIRDIKTWPRWPWLPMKRRRELPAGNYTIDLGVIYADQIDPIPAELPQVRLTVWDAPWIPTMKAAVAITMGATPDWPIVGEYEGVEQMLEDGWVVD